MDRTITLTPDELEMARRLGNDPANALRQKRQHAARRGLPTPLDLEPRESGPHHGAAQPIPFETRRGVRS